MNLLSAPLEAYDVVSVLSLGSYPKVRACFLLKGSSSNVLSLHVVAGDGPAGAHHPQTHGRHHRAQRAEERNARPGGGPGVAALLRMLC